MPNCIENSSSVFLQFEGRKDAKVQSNLPWTPFQCSFIFQSSAQQVEYSPCLLALDGLTDRNRDKIQLLPTCPKNIVTIDITISAATNTHMSKNIFIFDINIKQQSTNVVTINISTDITMTSMFKNVFTNITTVTFHNSNLYHDRDAVAVIQMLVLIPMHMLILVLKVMLTLLPC